MKFNGKYILSKKQRGIYSKLWEDLNVSSVTSSPTLPCEEHHDPVGPKGKQGRPGFKKIEGQSGAIDFSVKIVSLLNEKQKTHNKKNDQRVRLDDLKKVYIRGAEMFTPNGECDPRAAWAIARVNTFLRIKEEGLRSDAKIKSCNDLVVNLNEMDVMEDWCPSKNDLDKAYEDIKAHDLYLDFDNVEELFLESEKDPSPRFTNW